MSKETIGEIFERNPREALEEALRRSAPQPLFCWQTMLGTNGVRYGQYRNFSKDQLDSGAYEIEFLDCAISIFWTDVLYNPRTNTKIQKPPYIGVELGYN